MDGTDFVCVVLCTFAFIGLAKLLASGRHGE